MLLLLEYMTISTQMHITKYTHHMHVCQPWNALSQLKASAEMFRAHRLVSNKRISIFTPFPHLMCIFCIFSASLVSELHLNCIQLASELHLIGI